MIEKYTAQATTKEDAINKGLKELGISREEAEVEINDPGKKGFLGIGQKDAVVTVKRKKSVSIEETNISAEIDSANEEAEKQTKTINEELEEAVEEAGEEIEQAEEEAVMPPISTDRAGEKSEETEDSELEEAVEQTEEEAVMPPVSTEEVTEEDETSEEEKEEELKRQREIEETDEKAIEQVQSYLHDILIHMGIEDAEVVTDRKEEQVQFDVETKDAGLVIGRHGKVLNGLQTLIQIQLHQLAETKLFARVDAENYRNRRKDTVENLAKKTAYKVKKTKQPIILEPMPAHERKQIHRHLYNDSKIKTHSEGKEPHRYLVVEPADL